MGKFIGLKVEASGKGKTATPSGEKPTGEKMASRKEPVRPKKD